MGIWLGMTVRGIGQAFDLYVGGVWWKWAGIATSRPINGR